jgi:plastocyanin
MPWGSWINELPTEFFLVVHIAAFAIGVGFAWLAFKRELGLLGAAFSLFAATVQVDEQEDNEVGPGESFSITFDEPGTYRYVCTLHRQDMDGEVIVR